MPKICPLYKIAAMLGKFSNLPDEDIAELILCNREDCALWVPSKIQPEKYGSCGLRNTGKG